MLHKLKSESLHNFFNHFFFIEYFKSFCCLLSKYWIQNSCIYSIHLEFTKPFHLNWKQNVSHFMEELEFNGLSNFHFKNWFWHWVFKSKGFHIFWPQLFENSHPPNCSMWPHKELRKVLQRLKNFIWTLE